MLSRTTLCRTPALLLSLTLISPVSAAPATEPDRAPGRPGPRPVIILPGLMGTELERSDTGKKAWGNYFDLTFGSPHRGLVDPRFDGLELPTSSTTMRDNRDSIVPSGILTRMTIVPKLISVDAYSRWLRILGEAGYTNGDIEHPRPGDNCFVLAYDWRRDLVEAARQLADRIEGIREAFGDPNLKVDLLAHSMGGLVARYYILYGGEDVLDRDVMPGPTFAGADRVANLILLGTPNEGAMTSLHAMLDGTRVGMRRISPLVLFTMPSCYQLLPSPDAPVFVGPEGQRVRVDLYDPATWRELHWSIHDPGLREQFYEECRSLLGPASEDAFRSRYSEWERFLAAALRRGLRFRRALDGDKGVDVPTRYWLLGGDCEPTRARAVVHDASGERRAAIESRDRPPGMSRAAFRSLTRAAGDGRVVRSSLLGWSDGSSDPALAPAFANARSGWACAGHFKMAIHPEIHACVLSILRDAEPVACPARLDGSRAP